MLTRVEAKKLEKACELYMTCKDIYPYDEDRIEMIRALADNEETIFIDHKEFTKIADYI